MNDHQKKEILEYLHRKAQAPLLYRCVARAVDAAELFRAHPPGRRPRKFARSKT
jgi:hypothetical protein